MKIGNFIKILIMLVILVVFAFIFFYMGYKFYIFNNTITTITNETPTTPQPSTQTTSQTSTGNNSNSYTNPTYGYTLSNLNGWSLNLQNANPSNNEPAYLANASIITLSKGNATITFIYNGDMDYSNFPNYIPLEITKENILGQSYENIITNNTPSCTANPTFSTQMVESWASTVPESCLNTVNQIFTILSPNNPIQAIYSTNQITNMSNLFLNSNTNTQINNKPAFISISLSQPIPLSQVNTNQEVQEYMSILESLKF